MRFKTILYFIIFQLEFLSAKAQSHGDTVLTLCGSVEPIYNIYEINKAFFSFPQYGRGLGIKPGYLISGKQYFKRELPYWLKIDFGSRRNEVPSGVWVKPFRGDCQVIDTFLYKGIELKYPLEIDGKLLKDSFIYSSETQPVLIDGFQFVKDCAGFPYRHFEIVTEKSR